MVQVPVSRPVTVRPETLHTMGVVLVSKVTARPEVATAVAVAVPLTVRVTGVKLIEPMD